MESRSPAPAPTKYSGSASLQLPPGFDILLSLGIRLVPARRLWIVGDHHQRQRDGPVHFLKVGVIDLVPLVADLVIIGKFERRQQRVGGHSYVGQRLVIALREVAVAVSLRVISVHTGGCARHLESRSDVAVSEAGHGGGSGRFAVVAVGAPQVLEIQIRYGVLQGKKRMPPIVERTEQSFLLAEVSDEE